LDYSDGVSITPLSVSGNNGLTITAESGRNIIELRISLELIHTGEYIFEANKDRSGTVYTADGKRGFAGSTISGLEGSGKITILEISDKYVKGSFEFTTRRQIISTTVYVLTVTGGEFYIKRT
jgi:hypothetical protein